VISHLKAFMKQKEKQLGDVDKTIDIESAKGLALRMAYLLKEIEWGHISGEWRCPCCDCKQDDSKHAKNCELANILKELK